MAIKLRDLPIGSVIIDPNTRMYDIPVPWIVAAKNHYGMGQVSLLSLRVLAYTGIDAAEPGNDLDSMGDISMSKRGNQQYALSNGHQWLNSDKKNWFSPTHEFDQVANLSKLPGFLTYFSPFLRKYVLDTEINVQDSPAYGTELKTLKCKVFLPSGTETSYPPREGGPTVPEGSALEVFVNSHEILSTSWPISTDIANVENTTLSPEGNLGGWCRSFNTNGGYYRCYMTYFQSTQSTLTYTTCNTRNGYRPLMNLPDNIWVKDTPNEAGYYEIDSDLVCNIDGEDKDLGKVGRTLNFKHHITSPGGNITVKASINEEPPFFTKIYNTTANVDIMLPPSTFQGLEDGSHNTLKISVESDTAMGDERVYTFIKTVWFPEKGDSLKEVIVRGLDTVTTSIESQTNRIVSKLNDIGVEGAENKSLKEVINIAEPNINLPSPYPIYTVIIDEDDPNPSARCTYADDAVGMIPMNLSSPSENDWSYKFPFNMIKPCIFDSGNYTPNKVPKAYIKPTNYRQWLDSTTAISTSDDVMVEFPKFYWRVKRRGRKLYISICEVQVNKDFVNFSHIRADGSLASRIYLGAYLSNVSTSKLYSQYGKSIAKNSIANFRTYSINRGAQLANYSMVTMLQILFVIAFKTTSASSVLGRGYVSGSSPLSTGGTDTKGLYFNASSSQQMKIFGLEDLWGNLSAYYDGIIHMTKQGLLIGHSSYNNEGTGYTKVHPYVEPDYLKPDSANQGTVQEVLGIPSAPFYPTYLRNFKNDSAYRDWAFIRSGYCLMMGGNHGTGTTYDYTIFSGWVSEGVDAVCATRIAFVPNY